MERDLMPVSRLLAWGVENRPFPLRSGMYEVPINSTAPESFEA